MTDKEQKSIFPNNDSYAVVGDIIFIFLPILVVIIININKGSYENLVQTSDWSFASAILFGQTIVKLIQGVAAHPESMEYQKIGFLTSVIIVFGLIPSIIIIALFEDNSTLSITVQILQFAILLFGIFTYFFLGTIGQNLYSNSFLRRVSAIIKKNNNK